MTAVAELVYVLGDIPNDSTISDLSLAERLVLPRLAFCELFESLTEFPNLFGYVPDLETDSHAERGHSAPHDQKVQAQADVHHGHNTESSPV